MRPILQLSSALILLVASSMSTAAQSPSITFSTFLGGSAHENLRDIATDSAGNVYVTGGTASPDFPTTPGAYDRTFASGGGSLGTGGTMEIFVTKFSPDGRVIWSTLLGGPNYDRAYAIEVDRQGFVYVGGRAGDSFPTTPGVVQERFAGDLTPNTLYGRQDPFIAKLSPDGSRLVWATYFGADDLGIIRDIDIDSAGNVFVASPGSSRPHPHITPGAFMTTKPGGNDMVVAKISSDGTRVLWATYLGGSAGDGGAPSIRVDRGGHAYVIATTSSPDLPTTTGAFDATYNGGTSDFMIAKLLPDGSGALYLTYLGGSGAEDLETHNIALDAAGNAYINGFTSSTDFPASPGAIQRVYGGGSYDIPVARLSADGTTLLASTYLGGGASDGAQGIGVDAAGFVILGGTTGSADFPATADAFQSAARGASDAVVAKLSGDLTTLVYASRVAGSDADDGRAAWVERNGDFFVGGNTRSNDFPLVAASQPARGGNDDGFLTKLSAGAGPTDSVAVIRLRSTCIVEDERNGSVAVVVERLGRRRGTTDVHFRATGTASNAEDYILSSNRVTFADGDSLKIHPVAIVDDALAEGVEYVDIGIAGVTDSGAHRTEQPEVRLWISDDERPGRNLLNDPGFDAGGAGWQKTTNGGRSIVAGPSHGGAGAQQMILSSQFPREVFQVVPVVAGRTYFASGWVKVQEVAVGASVEVQWLDGTGGIVATEPLGTRYGTAEWSWLIGCATAPAGADSARFRIHVPVEADNTGMAWFDDLALLDPFEVAGVGEETIAVGLIEKCSAVADGERVLIRVDFDVESWSYEVELADAAGRIISSHRASSVTGATSGPDGMRVPSAGTYVYRVVLTSGKQRDICSGTVSVNW